MRFRNINYYLKLNTLNISYDAKVKLYLYQINHNLLSTGTHIPKNLTQNYLTFTTEVKGIIFYTWIILFPFPNETRQKLLYTTLYFINVFFCTQEMEITMFELFEIDKQHIQIIWFFLFHTIFVPDILVLMRIQNTEKKKTLALIDIFLKIYWTLNFLVTWSLNCLLFIQRFYIG